MKNFKLNILLSYFLFFLCCFNLFILPIWLKALVPFRLILGFTAILCLFTDKELLRTLKHNIPFQALCCFVLVTIISSILNGLDLKSLNRSLAWLSIFLGFYVTFYYWGEKLRLAFICLACGIILMFTYYLIFGQEGFGLINESAYQVNKVRLVGKFNEQGNRIATLLVAAAFISLSSGFNLPLFSKNFINTSILNYYSAKTNITNARKTNKYNLLINSFLTLSNNTIKIIYRLLNYRFFYWTLCIVLSVFLILTGTRLFTIFFLIISSIYLFSHKIKFKHFLILFCTVTAFILFLYFLKIPLIEFYKETFFATLKDVSLLARIPMWDCAWQAIKLHPFFGTGLESYPQLYHDYYLQNLAGKTAELYYSTLTNTTHPHNIILYFLTETGIFGAMCISILIYFCFKNAMQGNNLQKDTFMLLLLILIVGLLNPPVGKEPSTIFFSLLGLGSLNITYSSPTTPAAS